MTKGLFYQIFFLYQKSIHKVSVLNSSKERRTLVLTSADLVCKHIEAGKVRAAKCSQYLTL